MRTVTQTVTVLWVCFQSIVCGKNSRDQELKLQILKNESLALSPLAQNYYGYKLGCICILQIYSESMLFLALLFSVVGGQNSDSYSFQLGSFSCVVISDGADTTLGLPAFYPDASEEVLDENRKQNGYVGVMSTYFNAILCDTGDKLVLIDTGTEKRFLPEQTGLLYNNIKNLGFDPANIDDIILCHGHIDHFGGLLSEDSQPLYWNANVWVPELDYQFYTNDSNSAANFYADFGLVFFPLQDAGINVIQYTAGGLFEGFEALDFSGHSPGHHVIKLYSGSDSLYYVGDTLFNEVTISNPYWASVFDMNGDKAVSSRVELLNRLVDENALVGGYHINFPGLGFVRKDGDTFAWVPAQWQF
eukprot:TRINITY_DN826_c0_g1_i12.p1 TRINITY_DN826_c0_g1~~TRINITY_DN826_c0_g1_i12.p1  ORF type:complete len:375 (-),score=37.44 TRINITY_DN826_c0_g1_i12:978-2057(-)